MHSWRGGYFSEDRSEVIIVCHLTKYYISKSLVWELRRDKIHITCIAKQIREFESSHTRDLIRDMTP